MNLTWLFSTAGVVGINGTVTYIEDFCRKSADMVTVKACRGANSLDTDTTDSTSYGPEERNTVELLLDERVNHFTQLLRQTFVFRIPTPPQPDESEVDNGERTDYRFEQTRLQSFANWPSPHLQPADLAAAGFYYTGTNDSVRCFECHIEFSRWEEGEDPMVLHQRWSGRCCFIRKLPCGNVPIGADASGVPAPRPRTRDTLGPYCLEYRMGAEADTHLVLGDNEESDDERTKFPKYASYEARLRSFDNWPICMAQTREQLAEAGLYYVGSGDMAACHQCGVGLKSWEAEDDPWIQHAKWMPKCSYVRLVKGQEFVDSVVGKDVIPPLEQDVANLALTNNVETVEPSVRQIRQSVEESNARSSPSEDVAGCSSNARQPRIPKPRVESSSSADNNEATTSKSSIGLCKPEDSKEKERDDATTCKICYNEELGVVFVPCGHIVSGVKCAPSLTTCAICRKRIEYYVRAYLS